MTKDEALRLAMDWYGSGNQDPDEFERLILSIVAQPEQDGECKYCTDGCPACDARKLPEQEPVAWRAWVSKFPQGTGSDWVYVTKPIMKDSVHNQPLYTTPPQRTWVGLTRTELIRCGVLPFGMSYQLYEAIEAKLKEKNEQIKNT